MSSDRTICTTFILFLCVVVICITTLRSVQMLTYKCGTIIDKANVNATN